LELRRYFTFLKRWFWLILLSTALAASGAFALSLNSTPIFQATAYLLISQAPSTNATTDFNSIQTSSLLAKTYKELVVKRPVLEKVIANLNLKATPEQLARSITVTLVKDTQLLALSVEHPDPQVAASVANEIGAVFRISNQELQTNRYTATKQSLQEELNRIQKDLTQTQEALDKLKNPATLDQVNEQTRLQTNLAQHRSSYATLLKSFEDVRLAEVQATSNVNIVEEAQVPNSPVKPTTTVNTLLAAIVGLLLGLGFALLIEYLDDTVKSAEQVQVVSGVSALGIIARIKENELPSRIITFRHPNSAISEAYRVLRANIEFSEIDDPVRTIVITSASSGEGKTITAANLAVTIAQTGKKVILVDTDLRRPMLHRYFEQTNTRGVTTALLEHEHKIDEHLIITRVPNLKLMPSGPLPPNPAELLDSNRMLELVKQLKILADVIIFDSPPILAVVDPVLLARICDVSLMVVQAGSTRITALKKAREQLTQSGTRLLGTVLNRVSNSHGSGYYHYYYYGYPRQKKRSSRQEAKGIQFPFLNGFYHNGHGEITTQSPKVVQRKKGEEN
jgi:non-specific protein-tyrosine kinase